MAALILSLMPAGSIRPAFQQNMPMPRFSFAQEQSKAQQT
jgi:hypothetical protein